MGGGVILGRVDLLGKGDIPSSGVILDTFWVEGDILGGGVILDTFWVAESFWVAETF